MAGIMLGNLNTKSIMERLQVTFNDEDIKTLEGMRMDNATVTSGKWHGFDIPLAIQCGDKETAQKVIDILTPYAKDFKGTIQITF